MSENLTFIMPSRNDNYSCRDRSSQEEQIKKVMLSIRSAERNFPRSKFILVEFCPLPEKPRFKDILPKTKGLKILTLGKDLDKVLLEDSQIPSMNFYEHLSKHMGIGITETEHFIVINQETILPTLDKENLLGALYDETIALAYKCKVSYDLIDNSVDEVIDTFESGEIPTITEKGAWGNGDFLGMSKKIYNEIGGLFMAHQNWGVDNEILLRAGLTNMDPLAAKGPYNFSRNYTFYCLDHITDGQDRPFVGNCANPWAIGAKPISPEIVERLNDFIEEIVEL